MTPASFIHGPKYQFFEKSLPNYLVNHLIMKFGADFVCQFCWRIDCRADERRDTGEILENGRDF